MNTVHLVTATVVFTGRATRKLLRTPELIVQTIIFPIVLFLSTLAVFSTAISAFGEAEPYAQRLVPGLIVAGIMFGSTGCAASFFTDLNNGFMQRVRAASVPAVAPFAGIAIAEALRGLAAVAALVAVGALAGFRFDGHLGHTIGFCALAALAAFTFPWIGLWLATKAKTTESFLPLLTAIFLILLFMSQSMVPLEAYPDFIQPFVRWNPGSAFVVSLHSLARGEVAPFEITLAAVWSVALMVIFSALAARGLRNHQK